MFPEALALVDSYMREWKARRSEKWVVVMRGLPGSGKTTFVDQVVELLEKEDNRIHTEVCSASDYFVGDDGEYRFDPRFLDDAHDECYSKFKACLSGSHCAHVIFVDNTNITEREVLRYEVIAGEAQARFVSMRIECRFKEEAAMQCLRSTRCVPLESVLMRYKNYAHLSFIMETEVKAQYDNTDGYRVERFYWKYA